MFIKKSTYKEMVDKISRLETKLEMIPKPSEPKSKYTIRIGDETVSHIGTNYRICENGFIIYDGQKLVARYFEQPNRILCEDCHD